MCKQFSSTSHFPGVVAAGKSSTLSHFFHQPPTTGFHYESGQQIRQHFNCHNFCGRSLTPRASHHARNTLTAHCVVFRVFSGMRSLIAWSNAFSDRGGPNHLLFSVLPRLKSSESSMFGSKSSNSNALNPQPSSIARDATHQTCKSYLTTLQHTKGALLDVLYMVTRLNFIGLLHYDVTMANSHWS